MRPGTGDPVLVTGATGFTGGHLARGLAARSFRVRVLARDEARARDLTTAGIEVVEGDLTDRASIDRAVEGMATVYNVAAIYREAGVPASAYRAVNAEAVGTLVRASARAGVQRVVHCSTVGVHGDIQAPPADEDAPLRPGDIYQQTKLEGERVAREAAAAAGVELVIARPSGIYGPGDRRLLKLFRGVARQRFVILGRGEIFYHLTYVDDLVDGFRLCGTVPQAAGRTYILAGGEVGTLKELVRLIAREVGVRPPWIRLPVWPFWIAGALCEAACVPLRVEPPIYRRRVDFFTKSRAFDISRARKELGYAPKVGLREGVRRALEWYQLKGWI
ncbi:MAG TPA: NAD-dependent epimerase/dehydratase family protein [Vicinamibacterales bacterium]|nr:NAD-dependent epimerase/dehydratase family protein [Vicinamibacterales bacterium]